MKGKQNQGIKNVLIALMIINIFSITKMSPTIVLGSSTGEFNVITSDTTWTKSNGPHDFTGDLVVIEGVTLTIESGVVVNLNYYELVVNGTLVAKGSVSDNVRFVNGRIEFVDHRFETLEDQSNTYSVLENVFLDNVYLFNSDQVKTKSRMGNDIIWTKADSPHVLSAPFIVEEGEILTIEAGATVDLNERTLYVNGTLRVLGTSTEKVNIKNGGRIKFGTTSIGWDEKTGFGSIIEHSFLENVNIYGNLPVKICNNCFESCWIAGESLLILDNNSTDSLFESNDFAVLCNNTLNQLNVIGSPTITDNTISEINVYDGSANISNNIVSKINLFDGSPKIVHNTIENITGSDGFPVISDNTIGEIGCFTHFPEEDIKYLQVFSANITNNHVQRGIFLSCRFPSIIANNTIFGITYSYTHDVYTGPPWLSFWDMPYDGGSEYIEEVTENATTSGIIVNGNAQISGNLISGCALGIQGGPTIEENTLINNTQGIVVRGVDVVVRRNKITDCDIGLVTGWLHVKIENNHISNQNNIGILVTSPATITNNTIFNSTIGIQLNPKVSANIHYNNIEKNNKYNILLNGTLENIDATNNWWGTTNTQTINSSILDHKNNNTLGTAVFTPFLSESNTKANYILKLPEFPSWILLPLFWVATLLVVFARKVVGGGCTK